MKESKKGLEENRASDLSTSFGGGEFVQEKTSKPLKNSSGWGLREHGAPGKDPSSFLEEKPQESWALAKTSLSHFLI